MIKVKQSKLLGKGVVSALSVSEAFRLAPLFKVLGDPTRLRLIAELARAECCVHQLAERLLLSQPVVSQHLRLLRHQGLVRTRRDGRHVFYALDDDHVRDLYERGLSHRRHQTEPQGSVES